MITLLALITTATILFTHIGTLGSEVAYPLPNLIFFFQMQNKLVSCVVCKDFTRFTNFLAELSFNFAAQRKDPYVILYLVIHHYRLGATLNNCFCTYDLI